MIIDHFEKNQRPKMWILLGSCFLINLLFLEYSESSLLFTLGAIHSFALSYPGFRGMILSGKKRWSFLFLLVGLQSGLESWLDSKQLSSWGLSFLSLASIYSLFMWVIGTPFYPHLIWLILGSLFFDLLLGIWIVTQKAKSIKEG